MTYEEGEALGCPSCAAAEPHICPFEYADRLPEPRRTKTLEHLAWQMRDAHRVEDVGRRARGQETLA